MTAERKVLKQSFCGEAQASCYPQLELVMLHKTEPWFPWEEIRNCLLEQTLKSCQRKFQEVGRILRTNWADLLTAQYYQLSMVAKNSHEAHCEQCV